MLSKFLASKWVTVLLILALAGAGWYVYQQGRQLGELQGAKDELEQVQADRDRKAAQLATQAELLEAVRVQGARQERRILEALDSASEEFRRCFDMPVPDGLRLEQDAELRTPGQHVDDGSSGANPPG